MSDTTELLAQLRDIRLPAPTAEPALWPLLVTTVLVLFVLYGLGGKLWRYRNAWALEARTAITGLQTRHPAIAIPGYAALLKRTVMTVEPETPVRVLHGEAWLIQLDDFFRTDFFGNKEGRVFGENLYRPITMSQEGSDQLGTELKQLINQRSFGIHPRFWSLWLFPSRWQRR